MLPFRGISDCLSVTFMHCAQMAEDINTILHMSMTAQCLAQIVLKPDLHRSTPSPNFAIAGPL